MSDSYSPSGNQPVTWINGQPIFAAHFLALGFDAQRVAHSALGHIGHLFVFKK